MISRHPEPDLLVEYASGSLSVAPCLSVTTHLQYCKQCSDSVESLGEIGGELLTSAETVPVSEDLLDRIMGDLDSLAEESPSAWRRGSVAMPLRTNFLISCNVSCLTGSLTGEGCLLH